MVMVQNYCYYIERVLFIHSFNTDEVLFERKRKKQRCIRSELAIKKILKQP